MKLPTIREGILLGIIIVLVGVLAYGAIWFNTKYVLMPVPREMKGNVEVCIDNNLACSLIYKDKEEVPGLE